MAGYRTRGPLDIYHQAYGLKVCIPTVDQFGERCIICKKNMIEPNNILLLHKADGIQVYYICGKQSCWIKLGKKMAEGKR